MPVSEHTIVINKPIDYVFRNMTCMRGCVNWLTSLVGAEKIGDEPVHVGTQYWETFKFMGSTGQTLITIRAYDQMNMAGHDNPRTHPQPFFFLTITYAVEKNLPVTVADECVNPVDNCKCHKVKFLLVLNTVF